MERKKEKMTLSLALQLARPSSWVASIIPVLFGIVFAVWKGAPFSLWKATSLLLCCILMQSSVNTWNDYFDFIKGTDSIHDTIEKKEATLLHHSLHVEHVFLLGIFYLILGGLLGFIGSLQAGFLPFGIAFLGALVVFLYSGGPVPISYLPIGEMVSGVVMGMLIPLAVVTVFDGKFHEEVFLYALPLSLGISLFLMSNNICDIEKDTRAKRKTLPILLGRKRAKICYRICLLFWLLFSFLFSYFLAQHYVIITIFFLFFYKKIFLWLWKSRLTPEVRIEQMKYIGKANIIVNIAYLLPIYLHILFRNL